MISSGFRRLINEGRDGNRSVMNDADWRICAADRERLDRHVTLRRLIFFAALFFCYLFLFVLFCFFVFEGSAAVNQRRTGLYRVFFTEFFLCVCVCAGVAAVA